LFSLFEANRGMLNPPRCTPTKPPDPLRADALPSPTSTLCNTQETQGAQRPFSCTWLVLQKRPIFLSRAQLRGTPPFSLPPPLLTRSSYGHSRCRNIHSYFFPYLSFIAKAYLYVLRTTKSSLLRAVPIPLCERPDPIPGRGCRRWDLLGLH
jgi:hypothetical protein